MQSNSFKLKKYINQVGFYAMIDIELKPELAGVFNVQYNSLLVDEEWYSSLQFAIEYVFEHYLVSEKKGFSVFVKKLHTMTGDSSKMTVVYATIQCLCEMLGIKENQLVVMDENNGTFILTK